MSVDLMADRYAAALCSCFEVDDLEDLLEVMETLRDEFSRAMDPVFLNPNVTHEQRMNVVSRTCEELDGPGSDVVKRFCELLVQKDRFQYFDAVVDAVNREVNRRLKRKPAVVHSARSLDDDQRESLQKNLSERFDSGILLEEHEKPELMAGLQVQVDDLLMDYSIAHRLNLLKKRFSNSMN